jgi:hypothetical protein
VEFGEQDPVAAEDKCGPFDFAYGLVAGEPWQIQPFALTMQEFR